MFDFVNTFRVGFYKRPFNIGLSRRARRKRRHSEKGTIYTPEHGYGHLKELQQIQHTLAWLWDQGRIANFYF